MGELTYFERVYAVVRRIPRGKVATYGQIARMLGNARASRAVGYALRALSYKQDALCYTGIPWQRVINSQGGISLAGMDKVAQAGLLQEEGVIVSPECCIDLEEFGWEGLLPHEVEKILAEEEDFYERTKP